MLPCRTPCSFRCGGLGTMLLRLPCALTSYSVRTLPTGPETWAQSLRWEGPLEKGKAAHSSILAWRICTAHGVAKSRT